MQDVVQKPTISQASEFIDYFPLPDHIEEHMTIAGKRRFAHEFIAVRDAVETAYYAEMDQQTSPGQRTRKFLGAMIDPMIGKPLKDAEEFYQTYGRLMRWAWLSISIGLFDDEIAAITDPAERLHLAQVNTVDMNWRPAVSRISQQGGSGLIVEIGTGRGNSVTRLAQLLPEARIISVTISDEQYTIANRIVEQMGLANVEIRLGDIFNRAVTEDLIGQADAVGAIEVTGHFPDERKKEGIELFTEFLKPGGTLSFMDSTVHTPLSKSTRNYYANQSWYFGSRELYTHSVVDAGLDLTAYIDYSPHSIRTMSESGPLLEQNRDKLRQDFGWLMSYLWPMVPRLNVRTMGNTGYVHVVGTKP